MADFIYFGEQFSHANTDGEFGSFTCLHTELGVDWPAIQAALERGEEVHVRQALPHEMENMEAFLAEHHAKWTAPTTVSGRSVRKVH